MKKIPQVMSALGAAVATALVAMAADAAVLPTTQTDSSWYQDGAAAVAAKVAQARNTGTAKNIIFFVGDGMGVSTLTAARIYQGQQAGNSGEENRLSFETFPYSALSKTYSVNQQTPDSAPTMTAMITGVKTEDGMLSVSADSIRGNCLSSQGNELKTALELAEDRGKSTGIVSTARITHATPAATYAHTPERDWEADSNLTAEAVANGCHDIAYQLVMDAPGDGLEVALGGGRSYFLPNTVTDGEGAKGRRKDGNDLTAKWSEQFTNAAYVWNQAQFDAIDVTKTDHLLGLFEASHMQYEADRADDTAGEPSLAEMTSKAIDMLAKNDKGYFLMVEGGRIDHAHHAGNAARALADTVALSDAVKAALGKVDLEDTLIIVSADHSHTFTIAGYPARGNPILGLVHEPNDEAIAVNAATADDGLPYTTLGYANGPGAKQGARSDLSGIDTTDVDFLQQAQVPMGSETHAAEDVAIYATGPGAYLFQGNVEQNVIFHVMNQAGALGGSKY
ncbi:alkaline phosphatase [Gallaecimonas pentaromativorans]|uniref:Alkaline phosphatase n=1 Tax=Gallaecimonas pentaromativorans TaxID=584787 RepID=A0A3N1NU04_9GAMM|nr:alkaline phosphatase [Gallaecimonas pentaromativorans]ROQ18931.1 alkaline phosphatase [Gallaecimonas pentaromativorans]